MSKSLVRMVYASRATAAFREADIPAIVAHARLRNARDELTGLLLYIEGTFLQSLEGPSGKVDALFLNLADDPRHASVRLLSRETATERMYEGWTMDQATVDAIDAGTLLGDADLFADPGVIARLDAAGAQRLLLAYRRRPWEGVRQTPKSARG